MEEKKSKKGIIITLLILVIIILAGVGGYFGYKNWEANQTVGTEWGDKYLERLQNGIEQGIYKDAINGKLSFKQLETNKAPAMVVSYENDTIKMLEISVINEEGEIKGIGFQTEKENELDLEILYDIENKEYGWYEHEKKADGSETFTKVDQKDIEEGTVPAEDKVHEFTQEEMTEQEVGEGEISSIPRFDEEFIKPEIEEKETDVDLNGEVDEKELKDKVKEAVGDYKSQDETVSNEVKEETDKKLEELETKKEEIKAAEEEKARQEEEARKQAEEEARRKAEEEAAKGLKVGKYTLKYGKYVGYETDYDTGSKDKITYILNADGTYSLSHSTGYSESGTYKVISLSSMGSYYSGQYGIEFSGGGRVGVSANNTLQVLAGADIKITYQGN